MRNISTIVGGLIHSRKATILFALLVTFMGVALLIDRPEGVVLSVLALPFLVSGGALFVWSVSPRRTGLAGNHDSIAERFLKRVSFSVRLLPCFRLIGGTIVVLDRKSTRLNSSH